MKTKFNIKPFIKRTTKNEYFSNKENKPKSEEWQGTMNKVQLLNE